jgi:hypothetical protein
VVADPQSEKALPPNAVFKAVNSLYDDELRPNLGLVRRRLKELYDVLVPITDLRKVIQSLVKANILIVQGDPQEPVLTLTARPGCSFIDPMDPHQPYDVGIFQRMQVLMNTVAVSDPQRLYKGGRYGMAQQLRATEMPELQAFSFGQVCHIVQLAIGKKIVGYKKGGALVPYQLSDSCLKNSAESSDSSSVDVFPPIKTVAELRSVLMALWMNPENHQGLPLSLVKDKIEHSTKRSLSEHLLGFSKLSHLFGAPDLEGCCELRHDEPFQPVLCPPSLLATNEVAKPGNKTAGKVSFSPAASHTDAHTASLPPAPRAALQPPLPPLLNHMPHMPPGTMPDLPPWSPLLASMTPMAIAMVQAHMDSLGAGLDCPPVPAGFSLGPEAQEVAPSSLDPPAGNPPGTRAQPELQLGDKTTDFFDALLADSDDDSDTPPPSFVSDRSGAPGAAPGKAASQKGHSGTPTGPVQSKPTSTWKEVEALGAMLESIDTAWSSNGATPLLRPSHPWGLKAS